jgi:recombination protein RecT
MANENQTTYNLKAFNQVITSPSTQKYLDNLLHERKGQFVSNLTALVANKTELQECEPYTLMFAALKATALNLPIEPALGMAHVIPYKNKKKGVTEAQFQLGYKGFQQLALRTGQYKIINTTEVRQGEIGKRNRLTGEIEFCFIENEAERLKAPIIGYVNYFRLLNGFESTFYMSREEAEAHALRYSQTYKSTTSYIKEQSKWTTDFDAMAMKTVIKLNISKNGVLSVELADAIKADQSVMREENKYDYVDNEQEKIMDEAKAKELADKFKDFND